MSCSRFVDVKVLEASTTLDAERYSVTTYSEIETLTDVDKQKLSGEIAEREYGITDRGIKYLLVIFGDTAMENNSKLQIGTDIYEARFVDPLGGHTEAVIMPFKGNITIV